MQTKLLNTIFVFILLLFVSTNLRAASYTWAGGTSSWSTSGSWSSPGIPGTGDNVTINAGGTYTISLTGNSTIANLTVSGTYAVLNLGGYTLTVTGTATFDKGAINNGSLNISNGSATTTFSGTTFGANLTVTSGNIIFSGSVFNGTLIADKTGTGTSTGNGGNIFNAPVTLIKSGTGPFTLSNNSSLPDTFNSTLHIIQCTSGNFYIAHQGIGNVFNDEVTFSSRGGGNIHCNYYGTSTFNDAIIIDSLACNLFFGFGSGSCTQTAGHRILAGANGFTEGTAHFRGFTQNGTTDTVNLTVTGTGKIYFEEGSVWNSPIIESMPGVGWTGARFNAPVTFIQTVGGGGSGGGSYFAASATIKNASSLSFGTGSAAAQDTFASDALLELVSYRFYLNGAVFLGNTTLKNNLTGGLGFHASNIGDVVFKGNVTLIGSGGTWDFGFAGGTTLLDNGAKLILGSPFSGNITLDHFTQVGSDTINFTGTSRLALASDNGFDGPFIYSGVNFWSNGTTFNNSVNITRRLATSANISDGGNVFNGAVTITDSSLSARHLTFANLYPDTFNAAVTFIEKGPNTTFIQPAYGANSVFKGNVTVQGTAAIPFGANGGKVIFAGGANQTLNKTGSFGPTFKKVEVNKSAGYLKLNVPVTLTTDSFFLTSGALITDATNILTVPDNGIVITTTAHTGYVHGPVKKSGNDAFEFPLGDTTLQSYAWHPLSIGAPSVTGVSFTALYTSADHGHGTNAEPAIEQVSTCEYWDISRSGGSAADSIKVTLTWNHSCNAINPADMRVAYWDVTPTPDIWGDKGNSAYTGNSTVGSVTSQYKLTAFGHFALADKVCTTLLVSATSTATTCYVGGNGRATATATLGTSPYTYSWTTGATTATITGLSANTYTATVTDVHGCTTTATATVTQPSPFSVVIENDEPVCAGGVLELDPDLSGGVGSSEYFSFSWTGPASFTSASPRPTIVDADLTTANSGTYSVTVTDVTGCTATASKAITVHPAIIASLGSNTPVCTGQTLQLTSTASAGTAPYTYNWQGFGGNSFSSTAMSPSISNIALTDEGNYQLIIIDQAGCGAGGQTTVVVNPAVTISSGSNSPNCGSSLQLTSSASAGTTPYAFAWTGPASFSSSSANPVITNAQPVNVGTYSVTVTDNKGCTALSTTVPGILQIPLVTLGSNSRVCDGSDLSLTSSVSGGVTPYTYAWTGPNSYTSSSANPIVSLPSTDASGYYHLSVSDHNGCVSVDSTNAIVRALPYAALFISGDNSICNGTSITIGVFLVGEGDITGTLDDGTPFTGFIGPLDFGQTFTDILVSPTTNTTYRMTSLHDLYCDTDPYFLSDPLNYVDVIVHNSLSLSATTVSCHGGDGAATITPSGGTAPYTYLWNTGATIQTITGLSAGTYSVNVTDAVGCSPTKIVTITTDASLAASITPSTNISCYGSNNGTATVSPSGGSSPYTYLWNNSSTQVSITGLSPSTYSVTVTDHRGCTTSAGVTITQPAAALSASVPSSTDVTCYAGSNGTATASQSGGTSPYTYLWSNSSTSSSVSGLPASTYSVTVTDHNGCTATATATVTQPAALIASLSSQTNVSCYGGSDGAVTVSSDGASPFTYLWSNSATTSSISGVTAATYSVVITDTHGCTATTTATITQPAVLSASIPSQTNVSCYGGSNGTATASQSGGTSPFNYLWSNSATASSISGLIASSYSVIVTDHNGCTATATATITQPASALVASVPSLTDVSCYGGSNGTATASQSGGTSPYTYLWNNSAITSSVSGLPASTYSVTVTDHNGCTSTATATVSQPSALSASITSYTDVNCATVTAGTATVAGSGGSGSNTYAWSNGSTSQTASSLATGTYTVTVTDAHGCTATTSVTISSTGTTTYTISVNSNSPVCETYSDIELSSSVSGGASPYNYTWTGPGSFSSASANPVRSWPILSDSGYYHLSVTDAHGCVSGDNSTKVEMHALPNVGLYIDGDNFICNGNSIEIQVFVVGSGAINGSFDDGTAFSGNIGPLDGGFIIIPVSVSPTTSTTYRFLYLNDETCDADPNIIADVSNYVDVTVMSSLLTWNGSASSDWSDATNWTPNTVPLVCDTVVIESAANLPEVTSDATVAVLIMNSGTLTLNAPLTVTNSLILNEGIIFSDATNILTLADDATTSGGSDIGYVHGPMAKIGDDAFTFPLGDTALHSGAYHPLAITEPLSHDEEFTASYSYLPIVENDANDTNKIWHCENWSLKHPTGSSSVMVGLGWNTNSCWSWDTAKMVVMGNNGAAWANYGHGNLSLTGSSMGVVYSSIDPEVGSTGYKFTIKIGPPVDPVPTVPPIPMCYGAYEVPGPYGSTTWSGLANDYQGTITSFINTTLSVGADFTIDANLTISGSNVIVSAGKLITVNANTTLTITNNSTTPSTLYACNNMWKGIEVKSGGKIIINGGSKIQDAQYAIQADDGSNIQANNAIFDKNYVGIYFPPNFSSKNKITHTIDNCQFTCSNNLVNGYQGQSTNPQSPLTHTLAGILVNDMAFFRVVYGTNIFDNLNFGIYSLNSNVYAWNARFTNINTFDTYYDPKCYYSCQFSNNSSLGSAIFSYSNNRSEGVNVGNSYFQYCIFGIFSQKVNISARGNIMDWCLGGIYVNDLNNQSIYIGYNSLQNINAFGVFLSNVLNSPQSSIEHNDIGLNDLDPFITLVSGKVCILVANHSSDNTNGLIYSNNLQIGNWEPTWGIEINYTKDYTVQYNRITFNFNKTGGGYQMGIDMYDVDNSSVYCNDVNGDYINHRNLSGNMTGIRSYNDGSAIINYNFKCNCVANMSQGIQLEGPHAGLIESNTMYLHVLGLSYGWWLLNTSTIGPQNFEGNLWKVPAPPTGWDLSTLAPISNRTTFNFTNNPGPPVDFSPSPNRISPFGWASYWPTGTNKTCDVSPGVAFCDGNVIGGGIGCQNCLTEMDHLIAQDSISTYYEEPVVWGMRTGLMEKLLKDTAILSENADMASFYSTYIDDNIGKLAQIRVQIDRLSKIDSLTRLAIQNNQSISDRNAAEIFNNDSLIVNNSELTQDDLDNLNDENSLRIDSVGNAMASNDTIYSLISSSANTLADTIASHNSVLSSSVIYEQNEIAVNAIQIATSAKGDLDSLRSYKSDLLFIAKQCPQRGGDAVIRARSLLRILADTVVYDDMQVCRSPNDTCLVPHTPKGISGPINDVAGKNNIAYFITPIDDATSYSWSLSDTNASISGSSSLDSVVVNFGDSLKTVTLSVFAANSCGNSASGSTFIIGGPMIDSVRGNAVVSQGDTAYYYVPVSYGQNLYSWEVPSGATVLDEGSYPFPYINLVWGSSGGNVIATPGLYCHLIYPHSINLSVSVEGLRKAQSTANSSSLKAYPNPTNGLTTIQFVNKNDDICQLSVLDISGRVLLTNNVKMNQGVNRIDVDMTTFSKGIYFVNIKSSTMNEMIRVVME